MIDLSALVTLDFGADVEVKEDGRWREGLVVGFERGLLWVHFRGEQTPRGFAVGSRSVRKRIRILPKEATDVEAAQ